MKRNSIAVFSGPSLPPRIRPADEAFLWLPPAKAGDLAALQHAPPDRLCLIDGLFESRPAPWHKEVMLLMRSGTVIFGAASMGALRAAELDRHGMIGVGTIYDAYRSGRLTGDDEVALVHATERLNWAPLTVPMVEVRATLAAACRRRLMAPSTARRIRALVRDIHFADRDWPRISRTVVAQHLCAPAVAARLERMHVLLKQKDALACLDAALHREAPDEHPPAPPLTCFIQDLLAEIGC